VRPLPYLGRVVALASVLRAQGGRLTVEQYLSLSVHERVIAGRLASAMERAS